MYWGKSEVELRKAKISDVHTMHNLINEYAAEGLMLAKARMSLYENLRDFIIVEEEDAIVGIGALHIIWEELAEIKSLAVDKKYLKKGIGKKIVTELLKEAKILGLNKVFTLTYQVEFFYKCGFKSIDKENLPNKVWIDCVNCPKFPKCDENAMIMEL